MTTRIECQNETPVVCSVKTAKGERCKRHAQYIVLRKGVKVTPFTNLVHHCHTACEQHRAKAEREMV